MITLQLESPEYGADFFSRYALTSPLLRIRARLTKKDGGGSLTVGLG